MAHQIVQPQRIARHGSGDRTLDAARRHIGHDLGKAGEQGLCAQGAHKIRLGGR